MNLQQSKAATSTARREKQAICHPTASQQRQRLSQLGNNTANTVHPVGYRGLRTVSVTRLPPRVTLHDCLSGPRLKLDLQAEDMRHTPPSIPRYRDRRRAKYT